MTLCAVFSESESSFAETDGAGFLCVSNMVMNKGNSVKLLQAETPYKWAILTLCIFNC